MPDKEVTSVPYEDGLFERLRDPAYAMRYVKECAKSNDAPSMGIALADIVMALLMAEPKTIKVWRFEDAPQVYRDKSTNGGDEDWVAFIPKALGENYIPCWAQEGGPFGCSSVDEYEVAGGRIIIGAHA